MSVQFVYAHSLTPHTHQHIQGGVRRRGAYHGWTDREGWHLFYYPARKSGPPMFFDGPVWEFASPAFVESIELLNWETA